MDDSDDLLRKFLNVYWLRPETALWRALDCKAMEDIEFQSPSLDLSCGDGVFSYVFAGGDFDHSFDVYKGTDNLDKFFEGEDIYDAAPEEYDPAVTAEPERRFAVGTDWKGDLLEKAEQLDLHDELVQHDNNEPLPFDDDRFKTVFSNSAYWIDNLDLHLEEIRRVLHPEGRAVLVLMTEHVHSFIEHLYDEWADELGQEVIDILERDRMTNKPSLHDVDGWEKTVEDAGFDVVEKRVGVTWWHAAMWDVGLRPISTHLIRMANALSDEQRRAIKSDWIDTWYQLLEPFYKQGFDMGVDQEPPEVVLVLEP